MTDDFLVEKNVNILSSVSHTHVTGSWPRSGRCSRWCSSPSTPPTSPLSWSQGRSGLSSRASTIPRWAPSSSSSSSSSCNYYCSAFQPTKSEAPAKVWDGAVDVHGQRAAEALPQHASPHEAVQREGRQGGRQQRQEGVRIIYLNCQRKSAEVLTIFGEGEKLSKDP